jgi:hypothetical protein
VTLKGKPIKLTSRIKPVEMWDARVEALSSPPSPADQFSVVLNLEGVEIEGSLRIYEASWVHSSLKLGNVTCILADFPRVSQTSDGWLVFANDATALMLQTSSSQFLRLKSHLNFETDLIPQPPVTEVIVPLHRIKPVRRPAHEQPSGSVAVFIITGVIGSGASKLGEQLAKYAKAELVKPSLQHCAYFDSEFWGSSLQDVTRDKVVAVLPGFCTASHLLPLLRPDMYVAAVVVKVSDRRVLLGRRKDFFPGFQPQVAAADVCVMEEVKQSSLQGFIKTINPELTVMPARGPISPDQARFILSSTGTANPQRPMQLLEDFESLYLRCELPLRLVKLENWLKTLESLDEGTLSSRMRWQNEMELLAVKGNLVLVPGESGLLLRRN